jgi:hypothetical protein
VNGKIMLLQPKNWAVFQHYKDRCPPWIKLHRDLLNDRVFMCLPLASKALAPLLWLLASESKDGTFDGSLDELVFRLHITPKDYQDGVKPLIDKGFFVVASGVLAECYQDAIPETEGERETETKKEAKKNATKVACPPDVGIQEWEDWLSLRKAKKAPVTETVIKSARKEAEKAGITFNAFLTIWCARGSQGLQAEWLKTNERQTFAQQAADIARTTVPAQHSGPDPVLLQIAADRQKAAPMPAHIRQQINQVLRKV